MEVTFDDKKLELCSQDIKFCTKYLGAQRAKLFLKRFLSLKTARTLEDVRGLAGRFHDLVGDRKGQWACDLDQPYRLIFEPHEKPIPTDENGKYIWLEIKGVEIMEITNYHGK